MYASRKPYTVEPTQGPTKVKKKSKAKVEKPVEEIVEEFVEEPTLDIIEEPSEPSGTIDVEE